MNTPDQTTEHAAKTSSGKLYLVPCPIAPDGEPRSVLPQPNFDIIDSLDYFIVENIRSARRFLSKAGISRRIDDLLFAELNEHTAPAEIEELLKPLAAGRSAGLISEAGVPAVADPGAPLVGLCHRRGIRVIPLTGPSSIIMAVMASGLNGQSFAFNGYLPVKAPERIRAIRQLERRAVSERQTQLFIEAPYRNTGLWRDLLATCSPATRLTVAADITAPDEYIVTRSVGEWRKLPVPEIAKRPAIFAIGI